MEVDEKELEAVAFLLDRRYGFDQYTGLQCWRSSGLMGYAEGEPIDYVIQEEDVQEKCFKDVREAARYFIERKQEWD